MHTYIVSARSWNDNLRAAFGDEKSKHRLSDTQIVEYILQFGRAEILVVNDDIMSIEFHNDYD